VAEDLGAWPAEQATVLVETLRKAGLSPQAKRTREGIAVSVPDDQAEEAQRQLVANMDAIASAARPEPKAQRKRTRKQTTSSAYGRKVSDPDRPALTSQKMTRMARPMSLLLIGLLLAAVLEQLRLLIVVATVAGVVYLIGKQTQREGGDDR
jgi:hypothetical protein